MTLSDEDRRRIEEEELSKRTLESEQASQSRRAWDEAEYRKQKLLMTSLAVMAEFI